MALNNRLGRWLSFSLLTVVALYWTNGDVAAARRGRTPQNPAAAAKHREMITALQAGGPHPSLGEQAAVFDRFVGTWDLNCVFYGADRKVTRFRGVWIFGWVLDGYAMQDVIIEGDPSTGRRLGTTVRFFDAKASQWRVLWIPPASGKVIALRGGTEGDRIVLFGQDVDGSTLRWSFNDIQQNSFSWRGEISADGGKTWRTEQEMMLKRRTAMS